MTEMFGPHFAYGYLFVGVIIGFVVGRITAPKSGSRNVGGSQPHGAPVGRATRPEPAAAGSVGLEIGGQNLDIDAGALAEIRRLIAAGNKIEAIKHLREATGLGLAEAKQLVEALERMKG